MKQLIKFKLDFEPTLNHIEDNLNETNLLALRMLSLDLKKGSFFTLLPEDADLSQMYKFKEGGFSFKIL